MFTTWTQLQVILFLSSHYSQRKWSFISVTLGGSTYRILEIIMDTKNHLQPLLGRKCVEWRAAGDWNLRMVQYQTTFVRVGVSVMLVGLHDSWQRDIHGNPVPHTTVQSTIKVHHLFATLAEGTVTRSLGKAIPLAHISIDNCPSPSWLHDRNKVLKKSGIKDTFLWFIKRSKRHLVQRWMLQQVSYFKARVSACEKLKGHSRK